MTIRLDPSVRRDWILVAALELAKQKSYDRLTRDEIADAACVTGATFHHYFGKIADFRELIVSVAIEEEILPIIAHALAGGNAKAHALPLELKQKAINSLLIF